MNYTLQVKYEGIDFKKWDRVFRRSIKKSLKKIGNKLARTGPFSLRTHIRNARKFSRYPGNSLLYKRSKNNRSVLYNVGFLRSAPQYQVNASAMGDEFGSVNIGFIDDVAHPSGVSLHKILGSIIKGGTWRPSAAQRRAYWAKVGKYRKKGKKKSGEGSGTFTQPPRDFIKGFMEEVEFSPVLNKHVLEAVDETNKKTKIKKDLS